MQFRGKHNVFSYVKLTQEHYRIRIKFIFRVVIKSVRHGYENPDYLSVPKRCDGTVRCFCTNPKELEVFNAMQCPAADLQVLGAQLPAFLSLSALHRHVSSLICRYLEIVVKIKKCEFFS